MSEIEEDDRSSQGENEEQTADPEIWRFVAEDQIGKIAKFLNEKEEPEEVIEAVKELNPATGQSLLMWAVLHERFVLAEWLVKKCQRDAFAFQKAKELGVYDQWVVERKEKEEADKQRALEALEAEEAGEVEDDADEEEAEPPEEMWSKVMANFDGEDDVTEYIVKRIGELGVYEGGRDTLGNKTGLGQTLFANGDMFIGEYQNNKRQGTGLYLWASDSSVYIGQWQDNLRSGIGRMVYADGGRYYGAWQYDQKSGKGRYTYPNGDSYDGEWLDDRREGEGAYTCATDSSKYAGVWRNGDFTSGRWLLSGGLVYYGVFRDFKPHGKGVFLFKNGRFKQEGEYRRGKWVQHQMANINPNKPSYLELQVQGKTLPLTFTPEAISGQTQQSEQLLVKAANFKPLERWLAAAETSKDVSVQGITIRSLALDRNEITGLRLKVDAYPKGPKAGTQKLPADDVFLQLPTTLILVVLVHDGVEHLAVVKTPRSNTSEWTSTQLPSGIEYSPGDIRSAGISKLGRILQTRFTSSNMMDLTELCFGSSSALLHTSPEESSASFNFWLFKQKTHADAFARLQERLVYFNNEGDLAKVQLVELAKAGSLFTDQRSATALALLQSLGARAPVQTAQPDRPPTPPAPVPEPVPVYTEEELAQHKALLEAELAAAKQKQNDADDDEEKDEEED